MVPKCVVSSNVGCIRAVGMAGGGQDGHLHTQIFGKKKIGLTAHLNTLLYVKDIGTTS